MDWLKDGRDELGRLFAELTGISILLPALLLFLYLFYQERDKLVNWNDYDRLEKWEFISIATGLVVIILVMLLLKLGGENVIFDPTW